MASNLAAVHSYPMTDTFPVTTVSTPNRMSPKIHKIMHSNNCESVFGRALVQVSEGTSFQGSPVQTRALPGRNERRKIVREAMPPSSADEGRPVSEGASSPNTLDCNCSPIREGGEHQLSQVERKKRFARLGQSFLSLMSHGSMDLSNEGMSGGIEERNRILPRIGRRIRRSMSTESSIASKEIPVSTGSNREEQKPQLYRLGLGFRAMRPQKSFHSGGEWTAQLPPDSDILRRSEMCSIRPRQGVRRTKSEVSPGLSHQCNEMESNMFPAADEGRRQREHEANSPMPRSSRGRNSRKLHFQRSVNSFDEDKHSIVSGDNGSHLPSKQNANGRRFGLIIRSKSLMSSSLEKSPASMSSNVDRSVGCTRSKSFGSSLGKSRTSSGSNLDYFSKAIPSKDVATRRRVGLMASKSMVPLSSNLEKSSASTGGLRASSTRLIDPTKLDERKSILTRLGRSSSASNEQEEDATVLDDDDENSSDKKANQVGRSNRKDEIRPSQVFRMVGPRRRTKSLLPLVNIEKPSAAKAACLEERRSVLARLGMSFHNSISCRDNDTVEEESTEKESLSPRKPSGCVTDTLASGRLERAAPRAQSSTYCCPEPRQQVPDYIYIGGDVSAVVSSLGKRSLSNSISGADVDNGDTERKRNAFEIRKLPADVPSVIFVDGSISDVESLSDPTVGPDFEKEPEDNTEGALIEVIDDDEDMPYTAKSDCNDK